MNINNLNTLEEIQRFIDSHPEISNQKYFNPSKTIYKLIIDGVSLFDLKEKIYKLGIYDRLNFKLGRRFFKKGEFTKLEEFQKYINDNNIKSHIEFQKNHKSIYRRCQSMRLIKKIRYVGQVVLDIDLLNSQQDFQKFIYDKDIKNPKDFYIRYPHEYAKACRIKVWGRKTRFLEFPDYIDTSKINTVDDLNDLIQKYNISSPADMVYRFNKVYVRMRVLKIKSHQLKFNKSTLLSQYETVVYEFLKANNIDFELYKHFDWLRYGKKADLSLDFYIPSKNISIEVQGELHFMSVSRFGGDEDYLKQVDRDKVKYNLCSKNGIPIIYYIPDRVNKSCSSLIPDYMKGTMTLTLEDLLEKIQ